MKANCENLGKSQQLSNVTVSDRGNDMVASKCQFTRKKNMLWEKKFVDPV